MGTPRQQLTCTLTGTLSTGDPDPQRTQADREAFYAKMREWKATLPPEIPVTIEVGGVTYECDAASIEWGGTEQEPVPTFTALKPVKATWPAN